MKKKQTRSSSLDKPRFRESRLKQLFKTIFLFSLTGFLITLLVFGVLFALELKQAADKIPKLPEIISDLVRKPTQILSSDGEILYMMSGEYRQPIRIQDVPKLVKDATVAAEDRRFYTHNGIDYFSMLRAVFVNVRVIGGRVGQGGSTLTMQIAKRVYSSNQKTFARKFQDMALAIMMERELTKDQILELYLNQVYYGSGAYGIKAAAEIYFGKGLNQLSVSEAATLARLVRRPSEENPFVDLKKSLAHRNYVLKIMLEERMIDEYQYDRAINEKLKLRSKNATRLGSGMKAAPYFVDYILEEVHREFPLIDISEGGYQIYTTLNIKIQRCVEEEIRDALHRYSRRGVTTVASCVMDKEGRLIAMMGGGNYSRNQYNIVKKGIRQPGSSFKSFIYAIGLETGDLKPEDSLSNERYTWASADGKQVWSPRNANNKYGGYLSLRSAIALSSNVAAVRAAERVGGHKLIHFCKSLFGINSPLDPVLSLALGCSGVSILEMMEGYSIFQHKGDRVKPWGLVRIVGPDGSVVKECGPQVKRGVLSQKTSELMDSYLRSVVTSGTGRAASSVLNARGKTGTTNEFIDVSFYGYTDELLGGVWAANEVTGSGNHRWLYKPMPEVYGGTVPAKIWAGIMKRAQKTIGEKSRLFVVPKSSFSSGVQKRESSDAESDLDDHQDSVIKIVEEKHIEHSKKSITLEVCADSVERANVYCPTVILKTYSTDDAPRGVCQIHKRP